MRILILVHSLTGGGAEHVAALWARGFVECGYEVGIVLNCKKETPITYHVPSKVKIYNLYSSNIVSWIENKLYRKLNINLYYTKKIRKILISYQPDIAICVLQPWAEWTQKAAKGRNIKIINTEHNSFERPDNAMNNRMTKELYRSKYEINKRYDHVTVLTESDIQCVKGILTNVSVMPNPLSYPPADGIPPKEKVILAAGRLNAWHCKGFDLLIKAWGNIAKQNPGWKLQIAGKGDESSKRVLFDMAKKLGIEKQIEFLGYQSNMLPIYQHSSIFVLSSRYEGFGMVLIEAMSQGCACIACDYKGRQSEIITSEDEGIICPVDDVKALTLAITRMIKNEDFRKKVQRNAITRSKYYSLDKTMDRWRKILNNI